MLSGSAYLHLTTGVVNHRPDDQTLLTSSTAEHNIQCVSKTTEFETVELRLDSALIAALIHEKNGGVYETSPSRTVRPSLNREWTSQGTESCSA